jgi:phytol kinase
LSFLPDIWVLLILVLALGSMSLVKHLAKRFSLKPEVQRKLMHVAVGLVGLALPYIFTDLLDVVWLCGLGIAAMLLIRWHPFFQNHLGSVLHGTGRNSLGEVYFLLSIALVFSFSGGDITYSISMLILTFSDAVAALIGQSYGKILYTTSDGSKSLEGSLVLGLIAFICTYIPLSFYQPTEPLENLVLSLLLGVLCPMIERQSTATHF